MKNSYCLQMFSFTLINLKNPICSALSTKSYTFILCNGQVSKQNSKRSGK